MVQVIVRWLFARLAERGPGRIAVVTGALIVVAMAPVNGQEKKAPPLPDKLAPAESAKLFVTPDDVVWEQVLAEPIVRQPVSMSFDERGRLWVVNYRQYPRPAGLKVLSRDIFWRVVYDKVPAAPPHHVRGDDSITIHEDTDGDGVFDKHSTFVDGLNIVTAAVKGRGGAWVLNPPYLLFFPTKGDTDAIAGDPVVHLQGFGLEDTHSVASSLRWGPDGWLYASHGSTVTANITRPGEKAKPQQMIGQHIWRYHPEKRRFEIFAEGGGNAFGVEIDRQGHVYSGHNGGNTRGFHYVQGGYYRKGFEKHGVLANPYTFGFFEAMKSADNPRFTHTFVINEAPGLPARYQGKLFGAHPLMSMITFSDFTADRSSFQTKDHEPIVKSKDTWFRPVDIKPGPDGALYVADFYEQKIAHLGHNDGVIDRETGRIYRLRAKDAKPARPIDLGKLTSAELLPSLKSNDRWQRQMVQRVLGDRKDTALIPTLTHWLATERGQSALEALWALHAVGGLNESIAETLLTHPTPHVRAWVVRLLGDDHRFGPKIAAKLMELARTESDVHVRSQWASSALRVPAAEGLPVVQSLLMHDEDAGDIHVPLLLWWALEARCEKDRDAVVGMFRESSLWRAKVVEDTILARLMRRFAQAGNQRDYRTCLELFRLAPEKRHGQLLMKGFEEAFKGRSIAGLPHELLEEIAKLGGGSLAFGVRQGKDDAVAKALALLANPKTPKSERLELIDIFAESKQARCVPTLLTLLDAKEATEIRKATLTALQAYPDERISAAVVRQFAQLDGEVRETAEALLLSRKEWSRAWLEAIERGEIAAKSIPTATAKRFYLHRDAKIGELVRKHWGDIKGATTADMQKDIERLAHVVNADKGDPYVGKLLFTKSCSNCHTLHAHGNHIGPDLTPFKRDDPGYLLLHIINPSAEIREGFENHTVTTATGRILSGIVVEKDNQVTVLKTADGQRVILTKDDIDEDVITGISLMPEGLLRDLNDQQVRDLFAYLRTSQPLNERKK